MENTRTISSAFLNAHNHMSMKFKTLISRRVLTLQLLLLLSRVAPAGTLDDLSTTLVHLKGDVAMTEAINGIPFEVWLKIPGTNAWLPKRTTMAGTGFFVSSAKLLYLVTAKHIALQINEDFSATVSTNRTQPTTLKISDLLGKSNPRPTWLHHKDADVSVHPLNPDVSIFGQHLAHHFMAFEMLEASTNAPSRDIPITTMGFAFNLGSTEVFSPISKESRAASGLLNENSVYYFLLQDPSIDGFSGAPVIDTAGMYFSGAALLAAQRSVKCLGLISATRTDSSGGKMAIVIPSLYIRELIMTFEAGLARSVAAGHNVTAAAVTDKGK